MDFNRLRRRGRRTIRRRGRELKKDVKKGKLIRTKRRGEKIWRRKEGLYERVGKRKCLEEEDN